MQYRVVTLSLAVLGAISYGNGRHFEAKADRVQISQRTVAVGSKFDVIEPFSAPVVKSISNNNASFKAGKKCRLSPYGLITVEQISKDKKAAIVKYSVAGYQVGRYCPTGALLRISIEKLLRLPLENRVALKKIREAKNRHREEKKQIKKILDGKSNIERVDELTVGQAHFVPIGTRIKVKNPDPIYLRGVNGQAYASLKNDGESECWIKHGSLVTIQGFTEDKKQALVKYTARYKRKGRDCPNETLLLLDVDELSAFNERHKAINKELDRKRQLVTKITSGRQKIGSYHGFKVKNVFIVKKSNRVDVANVIPIKVKYTFSTRYLALGRFPYPDSCIIHKGGKIEILGFDIGSNKASDKVLVRYTTQGPRPMGTSCPSGVLFFISPKELSSIR